MGAKDIVTKDYTKESVVFADAFNQYIYKGQQIPEEKVHIAIDSEIISVFHEDSYIGVILRNKNSEAPYQLELYQLNGKKKLSIPIESLFDNVKISKNEILLYR